MVQIGASLERTGISFGNSVSRWFLKGNSSAACRNDSGHRHGKSNCFKDWIVGYLTHFWFINSFNSCYNNNNSTAFSLWVNLPVEHLQVLPPSSALKKCLFHRCLKHCHFSPLMTMFHSTWPVLFLWSFGESFSHNHPRWMVFTVCGWWLVMNFDGLPGIDIIRKRQEQGDPGEDHSNLSQASVTTLETW